MARQLLFAVAAGALFCQAHAQYPTGPSGWKSTPLWKTSMMWVVVCFFVLWGVTFLMITLYAGLRRYVFLSGLHAELWGGCGPHRQKYGHDPGGLSTELLAGEELQPVRRSSVIIHPGGEYDMSPRAGGTPRSPRPTLVHIQRPTGLQQPFRESSLGNWCFGLVWATSVSLFLAYLFILADYYNNCELKDWPDNLCFYGNYPIFGNYDQNSEVFFAIWVLSLAWFSVVSLKATQLRNFFRTPCRFEDAEYIEIDIPEQEEVLSATPGWAVRVWRSLVAGVRSSFKLQDAQTCRTETVRVWYTLSGIRYFTFECERHLYVPPEDGFGDGHFGPARATDFDTFKELHTASRGLSTGAAAAVQERIGHNVIPFEVDTLSEALRKEFLTPFYLYQYLIYMIWIWFSYLAVGVPLALIVIVCGAINVWIKLGSQRTIRTATVCDTVLDVLRDGSWCKLHNTDLVPGDVVRFESGTQVPCDAVIIRGAAICNEAALTGESAPVRKTPCPNTADKATVGSLGKHTVYCGTTLMQCGGGGTSEEVVAVVRKTGASTGKGDLLKLILFPNKMVFKYNEELPVVVALLSLYAIVMFILAIIFQMRNGAKKSWVTMWVYGMFTFSQTLSPLLPVALVVGQVNASMRLKKLGVFCINPHRIAISGKVRVFCFDKTGTLTNEELDFLGVCEGAALTGQPRMLVPGAFRADAISKDMLVALATCHAVSRLGDTLVGNQVEVKMFRATGWHLFEAPGDHPRVGPSQDRRGEVQLARRFEFDHAAQTMSVIVRMPDGQVLSISKGSPEKVAALCAEPPADLLPHARAHALDGCYVLAVATRKLGDMDEHAIADMPRSEVEAPGRQSLLGLIMFRNELKPDTAAAMDSLKAGDVRPVMITGDNAQCGYYIARSSRMIKENAPVWLAEVKHAHGDVTWHRMGTHMQPGHFALGHSEEHLLTSQVQELLARDEEVELAMTGVAYEELCRTGHIDHLLLRTRIFARTPPDGKVDIVNRHVRRGLVTSMAGDGGNDCGALRVAHAGIALSDAEASVVAPFTSRTKTITSCVDLLREGRCSLCTSFAGYKFLITYGMIFPVVKLISFWYAVIMSMMAYFMVDVIAVCVLSYAMTLSRPQPTLAPRRPTSSLLGPTLFASTFGLQVLNMLFMVGGLLMMAADEDYVQWPAEYAKGASWWLLSDNWEATVIFLFFHFQLTITAFTFSFGGPFRLPVWTNWVLSVSVFALVLYGSVLMLIEPTEMTDAFHLASRDWNGVNTTNDAWKGWQGRVNTTPEGPPWNYTNPPSPGMSGEFRVRLWVLLMSSAAVAILWERAVVMGPVRTFLHARYNRPRIVLRL
eukprot:TRINITY_DN3495_c0_g1_i1.p1 TRINITY_DN3495_c0_g1~~TRINITY_DN3495_c0_g1_i1.p1  ORF type:complete len:1335 (+),score=358.47 TRINITY_DN3495_c0_g1_i1:74-4078(+)